MAAPVASIRIFEGAAVQLPAHDTRVTYPDGATASVGEVVHVAALADGRTAVILDETAFHPVDTAWPDQPADRGVLRTDAGERPLVDAVVGAIRDGELFLGADVPVRTGTEGWTFVVAHVVEGSAPGVGERVEIAVDLDYRSALSAGHTACHLASLALDAALADAWTKPVATDALGHPAFDALAIQTSRITPDGSTDVYRIGKSLRKRGFDPSALDDLAAVTERADATLAAWVAAGGSVRIERDDAGLSSRRTWVAELPEARVEIPCGGTHLTSLGEAASVRVSLASAAVEGGLELTMTTVVSRRDRPSSSR